jgi:hypothetical protein
VDFGLLWSSCKSSWLQVQRSRFDSRRYQIFWEVVGLEQGPLSFVSTIEELLGRNSSDSGLEIREYGRRDPSRWPRGTLYPQKLALISPTSGSRSVGIVRSRTQATEFFVYILTTEFVSLPTVALKYPQSAVEEEQLPLSCCSLMVMDWVTVTMTTSRNDKANHLISIWKQGLPTRKGIMGTRPQTQ